MHQSLESFQISHYLFPPIPGKKKENRKKNIYINIKCNFHETIYLQFFQKYKYDFEVIILLK